MAHILNLSTLLVMGLPTFNGPIVIWNSFISFMSNDFNPPYIMPHAIFKMHSVNYLGPNNAVHGRVEEILEPTLA